MKRFLMLFVMLFAFAGFVGAQPSDVDGDGVPDIRDACPRTAGPASNNGCPLPAGGDGGSSGASTTPSDRDGDGVPDDADACPDTAGTNNGCPAPTAVPDRDGDGVPDDVDACPDVAGTYNGCPYRPASPPADGKCYVTPATDSVVNVRQSPLATASVVGVLAQGQHNEVLALVKSDTNETWYNVQHPNGAGFVYSGVVAIQGTCAFLLAADNSTPAGEPDSPRDPLPTFPQDTAPTFDFGGVRGLGFVGYAPFEMPADTGEPAIVLIPTDPEAPILLIIPQEGGGVEVRLPSDRKVIFGGVRDEREPDEAQPDRPRDPNLPTIDLVPAIRFGDGSVRVLGGDDAEGNEENFALAFQMGLLFKKSASQPPTFLGIVEVKPVDESPSFVFGIATDDLSAGVGIESVDAMMGKTFLVTELAPTPTTQPTATPTPLADVCFYYSAKTGLGAGLGKVPFKSVNLGGIWQGANQKKLFNGYMGMTGFHTTAPAQLFAAGFNAAYDFMGIQVQSFTVTEKAKFALLGLPAKVGGIVTVQANITSTNGNPFINLSCGAK